MLPLELQVETAAGSQQGMGEPVPAALVPKVLRDLQKVYQNLIRCAELHLSHCPATW